MYKINRIGGADLEKLINEKKYKSLTINNIIFESVQIFIQENNVEIVDYLWGLTVASISKSNIKTVETD